MRSYFRTVNKGLLNLSTDNMKMFRVLGVLIDT